MGWLWGEKKIKKDITFTETTQDVVIMNNKVKLHLELEIKSPITDDIVTVIESMNIDFVLPPNSSINSTKLTHVELLSRGGVV